MWIAGIYGWTNVRLGDYIHIGVGDESEAAPLPHEAEPQP